MMIIKHWSELPQRPILTAGDCQLWMARLGDEDPDSFRGFLSEEERLRAGRLRSPRNADRFTISRGILRVLLSCYLACKPDQLVFSYGPNGKPELAGIFNKGLSFNISHSGGLVVFAIANGIEVGVDIEEIHSIGDLDVTASIFLLSEEHVAFIALPDQMKLDRFFTSWTCNEAILKAHGTGFSGSARDVLDSFYQTTPKCDGENVNFKNKGLILFDPAEGFKGALVCI